MSLVIDRFSDKYIFLSNFYRCSVNYKGIIYPTSENAYQAEKCVSIVDKIKFVNITPGQAKRLGRKIDIVSNWDEIKLGVMRKILEVKFSIPELRALLIRTEDSLLIEGNYWGDIYWGVYNGVGENWLGRLLMEIRSEIGRELCQH